MMRKPKNSRTYDLAVPADYGAMAERVGRELAHAADPAADALAVTWRGWIPGRDGYHTVRVAVTYNPAGFYAPWTRGNRTAYPAADSTAAALYGLRRKRTSCGVLLHASSPDMALPCASCGAPLSGPISPAGLRNVSGYTYRPGENAHGDYDPRRKSIRWRHYLCSWGATMAAVLDLGDRMR